jgi:maleate isomerase
MIGWRGRIGLIIPSTNTTVEYEYAKMAPDCISIHVSRVYYSETTDPKEKEENLLKMGDDAIKAAKEVASVKPAIIAFCCTSGSFIKGEGHDKEIINNIERETGIPAVTTSTAVLEAFKQFDLRKIAMATPYNEEIAEKEVQYFEKSIQNFKIVATKNLGIVAALPKGDLYPSSAYISAKEVDVPEAEAIFISCTAWRTIEIIELLEKDLGKPVITSNQATMWAILKKMGIRGVEGYGKLLREL